MRRNDNTPEPTPAEPESVRIGLVAVGSRLRPLNPEEVERLAESIRTGRLLQPILITRDLDLVDGYHRLEACKRAGLSEIPVLWFDGTPDEVSLAECDSNLMRSDLTALQRNEHIALRVELCDRMRKPNRPTVKAYEQDENAYVPQAQTVPSLTCERTLEELPLEVPSPVTISSFDPDDDGSGVQTTARELGVSEQTVYRAVQTHQGIAEDVRAIIEDTAIANSQRELLALAALPATRQRAVAEQALAEGVTVQSLTGAARSPKIARTKAKAAAIRATDSDRVLKARPALAAATSCGCLCPECRDRMKRALA